MSGQYGLSKTQLFTSRRDTQGVDVEGPQEPLFVRALLGLPSEAAAALGEPERKKACRARPYGIDREIDGVIVPVERGAKAKTVAADPGTEEDQVTPPPSGVRVRPTSPTCSPDD